MQIMRLQGVGCGQVRRIKNYVYNTGQVLGAGNFSRVYAGRNELSSEPVAIKVIEMSSLNIPKLQQLHRSEIQVLLKVNHPNVIRCYDVVEVDGRCYIITEICFGGDLDVFVKRQGYLSEAAAAGSFIKDVYEGLVYLAGLNIVHRDLKVANVFISGGRAKIADFGFAVVNKEKFIDFNIGSPLYMSPQGFISSIYGPKTDVWAFGVLIYEMLHGDTPYASCKLEGDLKYNLSLPFDRSKVKASISADLREVIFRCLEVDEGRRISVAELRDTEYFRRIYRELSLSMYHQLKDSVPLTVQSNISADKRQANRVRSIEKTSMRTRTECVSPNHAQLNTMVKVNKPSSILPPSPTPSSPNLNIKEPAIHHLQPPKGLSRFGRPISNDKNPHQNTPERRFRVASIDGKRPMQKYIIFKSVVVFKVAVNILHYCRCIFRCLQLMIGVGEQDKDVRYLTGWLILVLQELNRKMNEGEIVFDGMNSATKAEKLRQVRTDYERKYMNELKPYISSFINKPSLQDVKVFFFLAYRKYDFLMVKDKRSSLFEVGYVTVLLYDTTRLLIKCQQEGDFSRFLHCKEMEVVLGWGKEKFDLQSFNNIKKRIVVNN